MRNLSAKLIAVFLVLIAVFSVGSVAITLTATRMHMQAVDQSLNQYLAAKVIAGYQVSGDSQAGILEPQALFDHVMALNPGAEIYLLDGAGRILAYSAPAERIKRMTVSMRPVRAFLDRSEAFPILGDDPRNPDGRKVFSVAPVSLQDGTGGYVYAVLGGEAYDSVQRMFEGSYVLRLSLGLLLAAALVTLAAGMLSFNLLTRRLRRLVGAMNAFRLSGFRRVSQGPGWQPKPGGDEIDRAAITFDEMARRIVEQVRGMERAEEARRELVVNISHDLQTPLSSLRGYLETVLIKEQTFSEEEKQHHIRQAIKVTERLGDLTSDLFELVRLDAQDVPVRREPFALNELLQDVVQKFQVEAELKCLDLEADIPTDVPFVLADIGLIERVLENLVENAIKYTQPGGVIHIALSVEAGQVLTSVRDTGRGIAADDLPRVFDRFYRGKVSDGGESRGTGLGLAIAQRIVQLHGSEIEVWSELGVGAKFSFRLPVAPD